MVNDRQTHLLPEQPEEMNRIACFMAYKDARSFADDFLRHVDIVRANYRAVFEHVPELPGTDAFGPELDFRGDDPEPPATVAALQASGDRLDHLGVSGPPTRGGDQRVQLMLAPVARRIHGRSDGHVAL